MNESPVDFWRLMVRINPETRMFGLLNHNVKKYLFMKKLNEKYFFQGFKSS